MEKIVKTGKDLDSILNEIVAENNISKEDIVYKSTEKKKGLFKNEIVEVIAYKKEEVQVFIKDFLLQLINNLGLEVSFETKRDNDIVKIMMHSNNNNILIGHNGNTLKSLEMITKHKVFLETGIYFNIVLDVENYKDKKILRIERIAKKAARDAIKTKTNVHLENMNAYERRVVHNCLTNFKGVSTKSEGDEPNRHVVISVTSE